MQATAARRVQGPWVRNLHCSVTSSLCNVCRGFSDRNVVTSPSDVAFLKLKLLWGPGIQHSTGWRGEGLYNATKQEQSHLHQLQLLLFNWGQFQLDTSVKKATEFEKAVTTLVYAISTPLEFLVRTEAVFCCKVRKLLSTFKLNIALDNRVYQKHNKRYITKHGCTFKFYQVLRNTANSFVFTSSKTVVHSSFIKCWGTLRTVLFLQATTTAMTTKTS